MRREGLVVVVVVIACVDDAAIALALFRKKLGAGGGLPLRELRGRDAASMKGEKKRRQYAEREEEEAKNKSKQVHSFL